MLLVVPVSKADVHLIPFFTAALNRCGGLKRHTAVVVASPTVVEEAKQLAETLEHLTSGTKLVTLPVEPQGGWPSACNIHFMETVEYLTSTKNQSHWYWLELDNTPIQTGWADKIEDEYWRERKAYLGAVAPTWKVRDNKAYQDGSHMVGTGVYPANHARLGIFWKYPTTGVPFDILNQYEVINAGCYPTKLIQHQFQTINFRWKDGVVVCDDKEAKFKIKYAGPLSPEAVIHHGCKDGSLSELLGAEVSVKPGELVEEQEEAPAQTDETPLDEYDEAVKANEEQVAKLKERLKAQPLRCKELADEQKVTVTKMTRWLRSNKFSISTSGWIEM